MENWRRFIEEMLNAPIKDRPAQHIYPDPEMYIDPVKGLGARNADILKDILDAGGQNIGKDRDRDIALAKFTERMKDLLDGLKKNPPEQKRSPEEIKKFKEIDQAVREIQAQIQQNLMKSKIGSADTVDDTAEFGTPQKNIKTVMDFPPV